MLNVGDKAPSFSLFNQAGETVKLADLKGHSVVLYFYPKDDTPGCTTEACDFRDAHAKILKSGAVVLGVSGDDAKRHTKFIAKHQLPFSLLVDADHQLAEKFGAWGEKKLYGKTYLGIIRSTFLIGPTQKILHVWPKVKVAGHVDEVLAALKAAQG